MTSWICLYVNNSGTVNDIDEQLVAGSTESNSTPFIRRQHFRKYFRYARMTSLKMSKFDFSATISNINAQFSPVNRGLNSASIRLQQLFRKYFRYARITSLKISKFNIYAAVSNIYAQFAPVNRGVNTAYIMLQQLFETTSGMREWFHWNFQSLISPLLLTVFMRSLRQWKEDYILHLSGCNNFFENTSGMR